MKISTPPHAATGASQFVIEQEFHMSEDNRQGRRFRLESFSGGLSGVTFRRGFTLVELLTVLAIIGVLSVATVPMIRGLVGSGGLDRAIGDIANTLEYARSYAMGNNTYVYVGLKEGNTTSAPATSGVGRVVLTVIASTTGGRPDFSLWGTPSLSTCVAAVKNPQVFTGIHLASADQLTNGATMTNRPTASVDLGSATATTVFQWPVAGTQNSFERVIEFDPHGVARLQSSGAGYNTSIPNFLEVPITIAHGDQAAITAAQLANQAAIQVDGVTGKVRIYRP